MKVIVRKVKGSRADGVFIPEHGLINLVDGQAVIDLPENRQEDFVHKVGDLPKYEVEVLDEPKPIVIEETEEPEAPKEEKKAEKKTPAKKKTTTRKKRTSRR